jgi:hypothetical protein
MVSCCREVAGPFWGDLIMWQLYMLLAVWNGNGSIGGPIIVDGFKTEVACIAHMKKIEEVTPKELEKLFKPTVAFPFAKCIKVEKGL